MKQYLTLSLLVMAVMAMTSCTHVKIGDKDWSIFDLANGHTNDTPTQVHQVGTETAMETFDGLNVAGPFIKSVLKRRRRIPYVKRRQIW